MSAPLDGITVVALEQAVAAPFASRQLADLGARVIKVERADGGDFARGYDHSVHGVSSYFAWLNRGKESIAMDIKSTTDRTMLDAMIARSDVFLCNLAPDAVARLELTPQALVERDRRLVACAISGWGEDGPGRRRKAYDLLVQCESGVLSVTGSPDEPAKVGFSVADIAAGMYAFSGILTALFRRERTGAGSALSVSMLDAMVEWMTQPYLFSRYGGIPLGRNGSRHASISPYGPYRTKDGIVFLGVQNEREWDRLCETVLCAPDLSRDSRFANNPARVANDAHLTTVIEAAFADKETQQVIATLDSASIANAVVREPAELAEHPTLAARGRWAQVALPGGASFHAPLPPVASSTWSTSVGSVPALDEHGGALRSEFTNTFVSTADGPSEPRQ